jgi:hypothetical protein
VPCLKLYVIYSKYIRLVQRLIDRPLMVRWKDKIEVCTLSVNNCCIQNIYEIAFLVLFLKYFHILVPFHFFVCGVERVSSYLMGVSDGLL